ncbi:alp4 [Candida pseudojiufengensis]|uniref:alp4 n=1 Tax=Candida pseudojiufengensis TaxID=497109 RepID=UPI002225654B|nr:alp4 [Candida pseudojiufengensis]KAI5962513.1 alp4 [Candida pseudojiufengensis]
MNQFTPSQTNRMYPSRPFEKRNESFDNFSPTNTFPNRQPHFQQTSQQDQSTNIRLDTAYQRDIITLRDDFEDTDDDEGITCSCIVKNDIEFHQMSAPLLNEIQEIDIQQALIIKDLLFILLGFEGNYILYSKNYNSDSMNSRINGPEYRVAKNLDISLKTVTKKIIKLGKQYDGLNNFIQFYDNSENGKIIQAFCSFVKSFFKEYYNVLLQIEHEYQFNNKFNINLLDQILHQEISNKLEHLYQICLSIHEINVERKNHNEMDIDDLPPSTIESNDLYNDKMNTCKGGLVLQIIQDRLTFFKGDLTSLKFLHSLLDAISVDYVQMLNKWLSEGTIDDPFDEFMIKITKLPSHLKQYIDTKKEIYWNELFLIKKDGLLEQFNNKEVQKKILNTGKYLSIFKACTGLPNFKFLTNEDHKVTKLDSLNAPDLNLKINQFYQRANNLLLKLIFQGYKFNNLISNFQTLYLFNDSFNIDKFLTSTFQELKKNKFKVSSSKLVKQYNEIFIPKIENKVGDESCSSIDQITIQNQQFKISVENFFTLIQELAERKDNFDINLKRFFENGNENMEDQSDSAPRNSEKFEDLTILSCDLSIPTPFPLNLILNRQISYQYELMFKYLIIIKFIRKQSDINWHDLNTSKIWTNQSFEPGIIKWILRCRMLHSRIGTFITEIQSYVMYDVIQESYKQITKVIKTAQSNSEAYDLKSNGSEDDIIESQQEQNIFGTRLTSSSYASNSIFDNKLNSKMNNSNMNDSSSNIMNDNTTDITIENLILNLQTYTTTLLSDSMLTRPETFLIITKLFEFIIQFQIYTIQIKKFLILVNFELYKNFSIEFPQKFASKPMDQNSIDKRIEFLNDSFFNQYEKFGNLLAIFLNIIKKFGESENRVILQLSDRLEACFPE